MLFKWIKSTIMFLLAKKLTSKDEMLNILQKGES